jgi:hypothetical protein
MLLSGDWPVISVLTGQQDRGLRLALRGRSYFLHLVPKPLDAL